METYFIDVTADILLKYLCVCSSTASENKYAFWFFGSLVLVSLTFLVTDAPEVMFLCCCSFNNERQLWIFFLKYVDLITKFSQIIHIMPMFNLHSKLSCSEFSNFTTDALLLTSYFNPAEKLPASHKTIIKSACKNLPVCAFLMISCLLFCSFCSYDTLSL